jgi:ankyrin repeat protein
VDPGKAVGILAAKGFYPYRNTFLMHRILTWSSLDNFLRDHPHVDIFDPDKLHEDFYEWVLRTAKRGVDGEVILKLLEDRCIDLKKYNLIFAQKLENNELGSLMDKDGADAEILDFWHACKKGYLDDVLIFCKCGVPINAEKVDRHTSERTTPLIYAATAGHAEVVRVLLSFGADPKLVDLRGRSALHYAALKGHTDCCAHIIDSGGMMFAGDIQQNTALHLAAMANHYDCVNFLAFKALDITRQMTSDKVKVRKSTTFQQLADEVFALIPPQKLTSSDTVRFEKTWLNDAANLFISLMDRDVIHMLSPSCKEIMEDVLERFDPRPETGIFLNGGLNGEQIFLKTIPSAVELGILLKHTFRQSALDTINNWKRTPLHLACDANHINSHEALILRMIDFHGCNVSMRDIHGRRPIDLLIKDKVLQNMPTSSQVREELLIERRGTQLEQLFERFNAEDAERTVARRRAILEECIERDGKITERLWHCMREAAIYRRTYGTCWEMYEDPDTGNFFYCQAPANMQLGDTYENYSWCEPAAGKALIDRANALSYLLKVRSTVLRQFEDWQALRCNATGIEYYHNLATNALSFVTPSHLKWTEIAKTATNTKLRLGYGNEWEVMLDKYGNNYYRNAITRLCEYDRPFDAVEVQPAEMLCTAYQVFYVVAFCPWDCFDF